MGKRTKQGVLISNPAKTNQDSYVVHRLEDGTWIVSVADGHGGHGHFVSQLAVKRLVEFFENPKTRNKSH